MTEPIVCNNPGCHECHPPEVRCDKCGLVIPYMENGRGNLDGGMQVWFEGWYGGTIDPFHAIYLTLCEADALAFLAANPWLGEHDRELSVPTGTVTVTTGRSD